VAPDVQAANLRYSAAVHFTPAAEIDGLLFAAAALILDEKLSRGATPRTLWLLLVPHPCVRV